MAQVDTVGRYAGSSKNDKDKATVKHAGSDYHDTSDKQRFFTTSIVKELRP